MPANRAIRRDVLAAIAALGVLAGCSDERAAVASEACPIDNIAGATGKPVVAPTGTKLTLSGWAADLKAKSVAPEVIVWLVAPNGMIVKSAKRPEKIRRPDVAAAFKMPEIEMAGFDIPLETQGVPPGTYEIMIESRFDRYSVACRGTQTITLK